MGLAQREKEGLIAETNILAFIDRQELTRNTLPCQSERDRQSEQLEREKSLAHKASLAWQKRLANAARRFEARKERCQADAEIQNAFRVLSKQESAVETAKANLYKTDPRLAPQRQALM
jgi:hypothetical protein